MSKSSKAIKMTKALLIWLKQSDWSKSYLTADRIPLYWSCMQRIKPKNKSWQWSWGRLQYNWRIFLNRSRTLRLQDKYLSPFYLSKKYWSSIRMKLRISRPILSWEFSMQSMQVRTSAKPYQFKSCKKPMK